MGWCSATEIFDKFVSLVLESDTKTDEEKAADIEFMAVTLEEGDWDCQQDSAYWSNPIVKKVFKKLHPTWRVYDLDNLLLRISTLLEQRPSDDYFALLAEDLLVELLETCKEIDAIRYKES